MKTVSLSWSKLSGFFQGKQLSLASWILLLLSGILLFIFSLPHAIVLRKLLLLIAFLIAFKSFWDALLKKPKPFLSVVLLVVILQVWMMVIAGLISDRPFDSLSEWKGQWLPAVMDFIVGIGLARILTQSRLKDPRVTVAMIIFISITLYLCVNAIAIFHDLIQAGALLPYQIGISDHRANSSYLIALLEPILIADMLSRLVQGKGLLPVHGWITVAIFTLALFSLIPESNRNGLLIMLLAIILGAAMMLSEIRKGYSQKKITTFVLTTLILIFILAVISYRADPRWQHFVETVPIA